MLPRWLTPLVLLGVLVFPVASRAADQAKAPPTVTVRIRSLDTVIDQVKTAIALAGREEMGRQIDGLIRTKIGAKGLEGIDPTRPLGGYARLAKDLDEVAAVVLVPIADQAAFLSLLENLNLKVRKDRNGIYTVSTGTPIEVYFRFAHKYLYATGLNPANIAEANLIDPAQLFGNKDLPALTASLRLDQIPEAARQVALAQVEQKLSEIQDKKDKGETDKQHAFKVQLAKEMLNHVTAVLTEGVELSLGLQLDKKSNQLEITSRLTGKKGSKLATAIAAVSQNQSRAAGVLHKDAAVNGLVHLGMPASLLNAFEAVIDEAMAKSLANINDEGKRKQAERLLQALAPSIKAGELDGAFSFIGPGDSKHYTLVAAVKLRQGAQLGKTLRELAEDMLKGIPPAERAKVNLDAESAGTVKIHRLDFQATYDAKAKAVFGANPLYFAFRDDAAFLAIGDKALAGIRDAITATPDRTEPLVLEVSLARLAPLLGKTDEQKEALRKVFADGDDGLVRVTVAGGQGLRLHLTTRLSVVQFFRDFYTLQEAKSKGQSP